jgi:tRNA A37 threonylcarbamoyladenosine dehydratase
MTSSSSSRNNALAGFLFGTSCTLALGWLLQEQQQRRRTPKSAKPTTASRSLGDAASAAPPSIPQELREEQLSRHTLYFGEQGIQSIQNSKVCVVGLGGVGSHTALMLARGGVETLRLIDFDQVTLSSLNRHACATLEDVGIPKVTCVQTVCQKLGVHNVDARVEMYTKESGPALLALGGNDDWDIVIDCIDDVPTKAALLAYCIQHKIRVLSCMGAGGKSDMTRLHISDLKNAAKDPLASKLRQTMKRVMKQQQQEQQPNDVFELDDSYLDDMDQLTIIYSSEKTVAKLADLTDEQKEQRDKSQFGAVDGMRIRILPVLGPIPAIMGQSLAAIALCELGQKPIHQPVTGERIGRNVRNRMFQHLQRRELQITNGTLDVGASFNGPIQIDHNDIEYLMGVWRNRCAVTGARLGTVLELVRWDLSKPATTFNLVLMAVHAFKAYDEQGRSSIPEHVQRRIETRLESCRDLNSEIY